MHRLKGTFLSLLVASPGAVLLSVSNADAQATGQTLAQCVKELNDAYPYSVNRDVHFENVRNCQNVLSSQVTSESIGQCVAGLNKVYPYSTNREVNASHTQICSNLLQVQQSNSNRRQAQPNSSLQPPLMIVPIPRASQQASPQQFANCVNGQMYKPKEVCIDPWGGVDESCFYRGRGGRRTVAEPTGVTIEQARSICGG